MTVRSRPRALLLAVVLVAGAVLAGLGRPGPAGAATPSAATGPAAAWLAGLVGPDGAVENPYVPGEPSAVWTVNVALALAAAGSEPDALGAAVANIGSDVDGYVAETGTDNPGRLGYLIMLAEATGLDARAFGTPATDLVARLSATYGSDEPGLFGVPDVRASATAQALSILGLVTVGEDVPAAAIDWLIDQQCLAGEGPDGVAGGWQGHRGPSGDGLEDCVVDSTAFIAPDSNHTALVIQALVAAGAMDQLDGDPFEFLRSLQGTSGAAAGGFGMSALEVAVDPNSTALVLQALVAADEDLGAWQAGGGDPLSSLESWVVTDGPDAGALTSAFAGGAGDVFATFQGVWGLAMQPFPFTTPQPIPPMPTTSTTSTTAPSTDDDGGPRGTDDRRPAPATARVVRPAFTG